MKVIKASAKTRLEIADELKTDIGEIRPIDTVRELQSIIREMVHYLDGWKVQVFKNDNGDCSVGALRKFTSNILDGEELIKLGKLVSKLNGTPEVYDITLSYVNKNTFELAFLYENGVEIEQ